MARSHIPFDDVWELMVEHFPDQRTAIQRLAEKNPSFISLCDDYRVACEVVERYQKSAGEQDANRAREYAELVESLKWEIRATLEGE